MQVHITANGFMKRRHHLLKEIYGSDPLYRDTTTTLLDMVMRSSGQTVRHARQIPVTVHDGRTPLCSAVLILADKCPDMLQVGFFEAVPDRTDAVSAFMDLVRDTALEWGAANAVLTMNGHVNNGLGLLASACDHVPSFGSPYNPLYYIDYLSPYASSHTDMISYRYDLSVANLSRARRAIDRIAKRFSVRHGNFRDLRKEIAIYTELNNKCFEDHPLYFERLPEEDYELFKSFGPFLKEENFLVLEHDDKPIGFLLWYPDFCELLKTGQALGLTAALKYRLPGNRSSCFKIAELGVLPEYHDSGAVIALIDKCIGTGLEQGYSYCDSGWIFDSNVRSKGIAGRWARESTSLYKVFTMDLSA